MEHRTLSGLLRLLLLRLDVDGVVIIGTHELPRWPKGAHERLVATGALVRGTNETGLACDGCDEGCWVVPERLTRHDGEELLMTGCTGRNPEMMGVVTFPLDRLLTWRLDLGGLARALAEAGGLRGSVAEVVPGRLWRLGAFGAGRSRRTILLAPGFARLPPQARQDLLDQAGPGLPVVLAPRELPTDVPPDRATVVALADVLELEPDGLFLDLEAVAAPVGPSKPRVKAIPLPTSTDWESLVLRVVDDENVQVIVGRRTEVRSFDELGMTDGRRREPTPNATWGFLLALARAGGSMNWRDDAADDNNRKRVSELRDALKAATGLQGDPFHPYASGRGWAPRFALVDLRGRA